MFHKNLSMKLGKIIGKDAATMDNLVRQYITEMGLARGLVNLKVCEAWDKVSGAGQFTLRRSFSKGKLYVSLSSSAVRSQLYFQKETIIGEINRSLSEDSIIPGFQDDTGIVKDIILK